ncbi:hypothetical protein Esi_0281_0034 [Ectocarpus siliculosus]|uniref:Uncharacterized protein n=1 Tax=Ectocarpus siliculosus TaxID=2880 RepID=D8LK71_ECTSI|nr:hypothetical protein Esi_0281_0034 [Ectocarpus siliculosus]|eukprot:CBN76035.1 hypothetical protein Esi_0281_0034 [Ectocarpus siliculosus]
MPSRAAKAGAGGRSLGPKAGGEVGVHGKSSASQLDEDQLQAMKQKVETLQADLSRRQESYIRRERAFNMRIEELEEEVGSLKVQAVVRQGSSTGMFFTQEGKPTGVSITCDHG